MCKYCEGRAPLITTGCLSGHNIDVGIWEDKLIAESRIEDAYGKETVNKGVKIKGISISMCLIFNINVFILYSYIQLQCVL